VPYNYRPKSIQEIKDLGLITKRENSAVALFETMQATYGGDFDEFITLETAQGTKFGQVKILNDFKLTVDLLAYKKLYPNLALGFGNGSNPNSTAPTTQQQELVTLKIFEELLSSETKNYKKFEQLLPELLEIYPNMIAEKSWYNSFELQFYQIEKETKLPNNNFNVYNRDGGFMDWITKHINDNYEITKKDSWNPADIWLIKSSKLSHYKKLLKNAISIQECNAICRVAYKKMDIVGISLKKNNGKKLSYDLVNLSNTTKDLDVSYSTFNLNIPYNPKTKSFTSKTSQLEVKYDNKLYQMGVKSNTGPIGNITYEFVASGAAAFLGKVPKDMLKIELKEDKQRMPEHTHFMKFDKKDFEKKLKVIMAKKSLFTVKGDLKLFVSQLEQSWTKGRTKDNTTISQIVTFAYIIANMSEKRRKEFIRDLFFMSQKKGDLFGPFGKLS